MIILLAVLGGALIPLQTCINTRLKQRTGSPLTASYISILVSILFLVMLVVFSQSGFFLNWTKLSGEPFWVYLGGVCGVAVLTGNILLFPRLGGVQTVILPVLGQILMGMILDSTGILHSKMAPLTVFRLLGAVLVFAGVVLGSVFGSRETNKQDPKGGTVIWLYRLMAVLMGAIGATQTSINGYLGTLIGSPFLTSLFSASVSLLCLSLLLLTLAVAGRKELFQFGSRKEKGPWWMWIGGALGGSFVLANTYLPPIVGTGMTVIGNLIGSTLTGALVDHFGWFGSKIRKLGPAKIIGILLMILGSVLIRLL